jgi:hypothetical protein
MNSLCGVLEHKQSVGVSILCGLREKKGEHISLGSNSGSILAQDI